MKLKIILTGATGMVGEGVLLECLQNEKIADILMINRKHSEISSPKLKELIVEDFFKIEDFSQNFKNFDACFFCAGKSSVGMSEEAYTRLTYEMTLHVAKVLKQINPALVFNFISGAHTDGSEQGKAMWARVKGKTENELMKLFGKKSFNFRPALMKPTKGQQNFYGYNRMTNFLFPFFSIFLPHCSIAEIGKAMINAATEGYEKNILEVKDIKILSK